MIDVEKVSRALHKRRILAGCSSPLKNSFAEVFFFSRYNLDFGMSNIFVDGSEVSVGGVFPDGSTFLLCPGSKPFWTVKVDSQFDTLIFYYAISTEECEFVGWMPQQLVIEAPVYDDNYRVEPCAFEEMPEGCEFKSTCDKLPCENSAIWDYDYEAWDCFFCGKCRYDRSVDTSDQGETRTEEDERQKPVN